MKREKCETKSSTHLGVSGWNCHTAGYSWPDQHRWKLSSTGSYNSLWCLLSRNHQLCPFETDLEKLGSYEVQVLYLSCYQQ